MGVSQVVLLVKNPLANAENLRDSGSIPGLRRSPGGRHGNPLQCACLGSPMDKGAWQATVHGVERVGHDWGDLALCIKQQYFRDGYRETSEMASRVPCLPEFMAFYNQSPPLEWWLSLQTFEWVEYGKDGGLLLSRLGYINGGFCLASSLLLSLALASSDEASCHMGSCPVKSLKQQGYAFGEVLVGPVLWLWTFWTIVWGQSVGVCSNL